MSAHLRAYQPEPDFTRVRDFLVATYASLELPVNWTIERWNYARYFVAPMLGAYGTEDGSVEGSRRAIEMWEDLNGIWENEAGDIVGVACIEHPDPEHPGFGEIFIQRHPDHLHLIEDMLAHGEERFVDRAKNRVYTWVYDDDDVLLDIVKRRSYEQRDEPIVNHLEYQIGDLPEPDLAEGFVLRSMADESDIEKRREIFGRSFNHEDPREWPSAFAYRELQQAPDYHAGNDLFIVAPDGRYAACAIVWYDEVNRVGLLEPLGTRPDFRRLGLAREVQFEGLRRLKALGATHMPMDGGYDPFYLAVGFVPKATAHAWIKHFD